MNRNQMLELLMELYMQVHECFPASYLEALTDQALAQEVQNLRAYACSRDMEMDGY